jgi:uncharacterized Zn-binding protein involved in type VI secretion
VPKKGHLGSTSDHGGTIITASEDVFVNGIPVARLNDLHSCPIHGVTPIVSNLSPDVQANGRHVVVIGRSAAACGAIIISGSNDVQVN